MTNNTKQTRRCFLHTAAFGAAASASLLYTPPAPASAAPVNVPNGKPNRPLQLALASYTLRKFDLDQALAMTNRVALHAICLKSFHLPLDANAEQIASAVKKCRDAGILLYGGGVIYMKNEEAVNQAFEYAKAAGMARIVGVPVPKLLPLVNDKVQQYDIEVCIHNHGPGDNTYPTPDVVYKRIKNLDKRIGLCHDVGHTVRCGKDPALLSEQCADRLLDVHLKDVTEATKKGHAIPCGRGVIDLPHLLRTLVKIGYKGYVAFEYEADPDNPLPGLAESVGYVHGVLDTL